MKFGLKSCGEHIVVRANQIARITSDFKMDVIAKKKLMVNNGPSETLRLTPSVPRGARFFSTRAMDFTERRNYSWSNENSKVKHVMSLKRGKRRTTQKPLQYFEFD